MESGDCCWLIKGNGDDGTTSKPCQAHSERGGEATLEPFLQFVFAIHGSRQQSRLALGIALPCHCPAMLPRCSGHAESISLNRILTYLFWSEPRYKYVCGFVAHSELYRKRLFRKANLARQSRAGTWRSNLSQRRVVGVMRK